MNKQLHKKIKDIFFISIKHFSTRVQACTRQGISKDASEGRCRRKAWKAGQHGRQLRGLLPQEAMGSRTSLFYTTFYL